MYTKEGLQVGTLSTKRLIPWDSVKECSLKGGDRVVRHTLILDEYDYPFFHYCGGLGTLTRNDIGRTLVADLHEDGRWIDYLVSPK